MVVVVVVGVGGGVGVAMVVALVVAMVVAVVGSMQEIGIRCMVLVILVSVVTRFTRQPRRQCSS